MVVEEWRPVFGGDYEVSSLGRMRRAKPGRRTHVGRPIKPTKMKIGYWMVRPVVDGRNVQVLLHRLIAEAFIGPRPDGHEVNHIDGDKGNPAASNLEYVTHAGNMRHAAEAGLMVRGEAHPASKLTAENVVAIRAAHGAGASICSLARQWGLSTATAFNIIKRRSWRHIP